MLKEELSKYDKELCENTDQTYTLTDEGEKSLINAGQGKMYSWEEAKEMMRKAREEKNV